MTGEPRGFPAVRFADLPLALARISQARDEEGLTEPEDVLAWIVENDYGSVDGEGVLRLGGAPVTSDRPDRVWTTSRYAGAPEYLTGDEGETTFVRRDLADTATAARAWALTQGVNLSSVDADEVEMLPVPEHFIGIEYEWATVVPGTLGAVRYWRFRL